MAILILIGIQVGFRRKEKHINSYLIQSGPLEHPRAINGMWPLTSICFKFTGFWPGASTHSGIINSFYTDAFNSVGKFDFVLANPPFNVKGKDKNKQIVIDPAKLKGDPRYWLGLPITGQGEISNANYLWMQMFV